MKALSKKLLTMLLAVVMLVSVVPFQAMAATDNGDGTYTVDVTVMTNVDSEDGTEYAFGCTKSFTLDAEGVTLDKAFAETLFNDFSGVKNVKFTDTVTGDVTGNVLKVNDWFKEQTEYALTLYLDEFVAPTPPTCEHENKSYKQIDGDATSHKVLCADCGADLGTAAHEWNATAATTEHDKHCTVCGYVAEPKKTEDPVVKPTQKTIQLRDKQGEVMTFVIEEGKNIPSTFPQPHLEYLKRFTGRWIDEDGNVLTAGTKVSNVDHFSSVYYAEYKEDDGSGDGLSRLHIKARLYSDGKYIDVKNVLSQTLPDGTKILSWLIENEDRINAEIFSNSYANGYEWTNGNFYNYDSDAKLTEQDVINNGDKTVFVKLNATAEKTSKVLLYVHSKTSDSTPNIYEMTGYVKNGEVTQDNVMTVIKKHYSGSKMTLQGLYSAKTWKQLVGGEKPTAVKTLTIDDSDLFEVHVILKNASSNSNADPSNPKTGDAIFMTVTVMAVSAIALAGAYIFNKKRMVK